MRTPADISHPEGSVHIHFCELVKTSLDQLKPIWYSQIAGNLTISSASTSLMIRTWVLSRFISLILSHWSHLRSMALWEWKRRAVLSMLALSFGQFAILIRTIMTVQASWDHHAGACVVVKTNHILLNLNYAYSKWPKFSAIFRSSFNVYQPCHLTSWFWWWHYSFWENVSGMRIFRAFSVAMAWFTSSSHRPATPFQR